MSKNLYYSIFLLVVTFFWGVTFPIIKVSLEYISPLPFLALSFSVSATISLPFVIRKRLFRDRKESYMESGPDSTLCLDMSSRQ
jgi:drug/metabolite transporter (DMT)-like permease